MSMDDEFEGGQWINGEFYYNTKREKRYRDQDFVKGAEGMNRIEDRFFPCICICVWTVARVFACSYICD